MGTGYWAMHGVAAEVTDINADGKTEVVYVTERGGRSWLRMLDGLRGYHLREVETGPNCVMRLVDIRGLGQRRDILVSTFVNPIYIYADDLSCLWNCHFTAGQGTITLRPTSTAMARKSCSSATAACWPAGRSSGGAPIWSRTWRR